MKSIYESPPLAINNKILSRDDVKAFVIYKFSKGAKCFNGEWWGGTHMGVFGSQYGFDVRVIKDNANGLFFATAFPYKNTTRDINISHPLVNEFELGFHAVINSASRGWQYVVCISGDKFETDVIYEKEKDAHAEAAIELTKSLARYFSLDVGEQRQNFFTDK